MSAIDVALFEKKMQKQKEKEGSFRMIKNNRQQCGGWRIKTLRHSAPWNLICLDAGHEVWAQTSSCVSAKSCSGDPQPLRVNKALLRSVSLGLVPPSFSRTSSLLSTRLRHYWAHGLKGMARFLRNWKLNVEKKKVYRPRCICVLYLFYEVCMWKKGKSRSCIVSNAKCVI